MFHFKKSLFLLFSLNYVFSKKFIVQTETEKINTLEYDLFSYNENKNILKEITIGDMHIFITEYPEFPYNLYTDYHPLISSIEEDHIITTSAPFNTQNNIFLKNFQENAEKSYYLQENPIWNLDRIDQRSNSLDERYFYPTSSAENVNVFVIDTGIFIEHPEFNDNHVKPVWGYNGADKVNTDCNGHGTHVAGTISSKTYGVVKNTNLFAVKVLDCEGRGTFSGVLGGLEYTFNTHKNNKKPSVVNMSLGGRKSSTLNRAVAQLTKNGIHVVAAAGNSNIDACEASPASEESVITVGATTEQNTLAGFSNWGNCVDILAPGTNIKSTLPNNKFGSLQGTSMSSPHVAGVCALILSETPRLNPETLKTIIADTKCSKNTVLNLRSDTKNCLLYSLV